MHLRSSDLFTQPWTLKTNIIGLHIAFCKKYFTDRALKLSPQYPRIDRTITGNVCIISPEYGIVRVLSAASTMPSFLQKNNKDRV